MTRLQEIPEFTDYLEGLEDDHRLPRGVLQSVMLAESAGRSDVVSPKGARGAFQFLPGTAQEYAIDPFDPIEAAQGAARYLGKSIDRFGNIEDAIASYNAGPDRIARTGLAGAPQETKSYTAKVLEALIPGAQAAEPVSSYGPGLAADDFDSMSTEELQAIAGPGVPPSGAGPGVPPSGAGPGVPPSGAGPPGGASQRLGPPSIGQVAGNVLRGAAYAARDIPAGIEQIATRYLPLPEAYEKGVERRLKEYGKQKQAALARPGGTAGYVGGQLATGFIPVAGAGLRTLTGVTKTLAPGVALTAVKPYETEAERFKEAGISAGLGAVLPAGAGLTRAVGERLRPSIINAAGDFDEAFIKRLKAAPQSRKKGELLEAASRLGVRPSPGQVSGGLPKFLEEQMTKLPGSRGLADAETRAAHESFHAALGREIGLPDTPYLTRDTLAEAAKELGKKYDELWPQADIVANSAAAGKLKLGLSALVAPFGEIAESTLTRGNKADMQRLAAIKDASLAVLKRRGRLPGPDLQLLRTSLREITEDPKLPNVIRERVNTYRDKLDEAVIESLNSRAPELAAELRTTQKQWANAELLQSATGDVEGFVSGPKLYNAVVRKYKTASQAGDFGTLAEMGDLFFKKLPDSGTADRWMANAILTGGLSAGGVGTVAGLIEPTTALTTAAALYAAPKAAAAAYYRTPAYRKVVGIGGKLSEGLARAAASGAGRTGQE